MVENREDSIAAMREQEREKSEAELDLLEQVIVMQAQIAQLQINTGEI